MGQVNKRHGQGRGHGRGYTPDRQYAHGRADGISKRVWKRGRCNACRGRANNRYSWRASNYRRSKKLIINIRSDNSNIRLLVTPLAQTEITLQTEVAVQADELPGQSESAELMSQMSSLSLQMPPEQYHTLPAEHACAPQQYPWVRRESPRSLVLGSTLQQLQPGFVLEAPPVLQMQPNLLPPRPLAPSLIRAPHPRCYLRNTTVVPMQPNGQAMHSYSHLVHPAYVPMQPTVPQLHSQPSTAYLQPGAFTMHTEVSPRE